MSLRIKSRLKKWNEKQSLKRRIRANGRFEHDPHLARDIGVPYRGKPIARTDLW